MRFFRKGQNLVDLALLIGIVGLVIVGMEVYIRRGLQGKIKDATDAIVSKGQNTDSDAPDSKTSTTNLDSNLVFEEDMGGAKSVSGEIKSTTNYSSTSEN